MYRKNLIFIISSFKRLAQSTNDLPTCIYKRGFDPLIIHETLIGAGSAIAHIRYSGTR